MRVDDGDLPLHLDAARHDARKDDGGERADGRRQQQAEDERAREDGGDELPARHHEDLLHTATFSFCDRGLELRPDLLRLRVAEPPVTMRTKMSSRRGRAISMRAAGTAEASRGMALAGFGAVRRAESRSRRRAGETLSTSGSAPSGDRSGVAIERLEPDRARIVLAPDGRQRIVEHLLPAVHHDDVVAQFLGVRHHVRGEQDRRAALVLLEDERPQRTRADRVEAAERLVENQQIRLVDDGREELHLLLHALRELLAPLAFAVAQAHAFEAAPDASGQLARR